MTNSEPTTTPTVETEPVAAAYGEAPGNGSLEKGLSALFHLDNGLTAVALGTAMAVSQPTPPLAAFLNGAASVMWRTVRTNLETS